MIKGTVVKRTKAGIDVELNDGSGIVGWIPKEEFEEHLLKMNEMQIGSIIDVFHVSDMGTTLKLSLFDNDEHRSETDPPYAPIVEDIGTQYCDRMLIARGFSEQPKETFTNGVMSIYPVEFEGGEAEIAETIWNLMYGDILALIQLFEYCRSLLRVKPDIRTAHVLIDNNLMTPEGRLKDNVCKVVAKMISSQ